VAAAALSAARWARRAAVVVAEVEAAQAVVVVL